MRLPDRDAFPADECAKLSSPRSTPPGRKDELAGGMPTARSLHLPVSCHARLPPNLIT
ncbi:hypothetical protein FHS26_005309 [Rhizobium pisi]|uniref:Uncharacterized protein n=1 Tax=Rhizobium pisi TaxID=574561 RepID=A0A7W5BR13_9HYPH|nr:hypothetical protein [Rhizobium pisi]MBB3137547.1 hypothetical protein [Rhizobium pisi]